MVGLFSLSRPQSVAASTTTESVNFQVNKVGTNTPSLANSFFAHTATVTRVDGQAKTVTLHLQKYASLIKSFAVGTQPATITNATNNTADLTFNIDAQFKTPVVTAAMSVMNMQQKADLVFAKALYQPQSSANTQTVKFQVNKAGTKTPSIANSFFAKEATVALIAGRPATVTLHLQKYASLIKSFAIGAQQAKITNATNNTADLTFNIDPQFQTSVVTAAMSVMNMQQKADLVFAKALYQPLTTTPETKPTQPKTPAKPATAIVTPHVVVAPQAKSAGEVSAKLYQARDGHLTTTPSAAQQFIASSATVVRHATDSTVTLHTSGAEYIKSMCVGGQLVAITKRHGATADLVMTLPNAKLHDALPVTFVLSVPGASQMTQTAFLLLGVTPQQAHVDASATKPQQAATRRPTAFAQTPLAHAIDATKAQQNVAYTVLDASGEAQSTADQYFTHLAHIVKDATGYTVTLTVRVAAGLVQFTPQSVNGAGITHLQHQVQGGQDVWTFSFHVTDAQALDHLVPATILMSVPMANIVDQSFQIQLAFARQAKAFGATARQSATQPKAQALAATTIVKKPSATASKATSATAQTAQAQNLAQALPQLKKYPIGWELLGFVLIDALMVLAAMLIRRRKHQEVAHD